MSTADPFQATLEVSVPFERSESSRRTPVALVIDGTGETQVIGLSDGQALVVGRDPTADITIPDSSLSRRHAAFENRGGIVAVTDLGSTNGTKLNQALIAEQTVMAVGDVVSLGKLSVSLHIRAPLGRQNKIHLTHDQLVSEIENEIDRARLFGRSVSLLMVKAPDNALNFEKELQAKLRTVDRMASYGSAAIEVLFPEHTVQDVKAFMASIPQALCGVATFPESATSSDELIESARTALRQATAAAPFQVSATRIEMVPSNTLLFISPAMRSIHETIDRAASAVIPILIHGETGTGKEVIARAIHDRSSRTGRKLVAINCGAIPSTLVESVLFGHERGAFTGATSSTGGVFEEADGSTVLLDEIGELSATAQVALLRVLENKIVRRVGSTREVTVDVRVIAATHRDLETMVKSGTFREDLLYRLNALTIEVPALRERPEEIGPFATRFLEMANAANGRQIAGIDASAMRLLLRYPWPGNIRELRNAIDHAVVIARGTNIQSDDLPRRVREFAASVLQQGAPIVEFANATDLREGVQQFETQLIVEALRASQGSRSKAARRLQIPVRTLSHKIRQYGISGPSATQGDDN